MAKDWKQAAEEVAPVAEVAPEATPEVVEAVAEAVEVAPEVKKEVEKTVLSKAIKSAKDELKGEEKVRVRWTGGNSIGLSDGTFLRFVDGVATVQAKHLEDLKKWGIEKF
jgi:hypothetical protein